MLFMLAMMLGIVAANAQGTGTVVVADGTTTNSNVPVIGLYADDNYQRNQTIYPESMLTDIVGKEIQGITYYVSATTVTFNGEFELSLGICEASSFTSNSYDDATTLTTVYTGTFDCTSAEITLTFSTPFTYTGGNLLIDMKRTVLGSGYRTTNFLGVASTGACVYGKSTSSVAAITPTTGNFIPKTGFIVPVSCVAPTLGTITTEAHTATVAWTENGSATAWQLKLGDGEWFDVTENPYTLTGLTPETAYNLQLRSNCGGGDFSIPVSSSFTTLVSCPAPTALAATPTETSLELSWTESGSATEWLLKVNDGDYQTVTNPYTLTGLTANTAYAIQVRALCGAGDTSSAVSGTYRTSCGAETLPYFEGFEDYTAGSGNFPSCWTSISGTNYVQSGASYVSQGAKALHMQGPGVVATPIINIDGNDVFVSFDMKCENVNYSGDMAIGVALSPSMVESTVWIDTIDAATSYNRYEYTFHNTLHLTSGCIIFKQVNTDRTNYFYWLDSVTVSEPPACAKPTNLTLDGATENSLTLSWAENGSATKWVVKVGDGDWTQTTENPYTITGLTANNEYAVSVRAFCDPDTSDAISGTYRTLCESETLPYFEGFEDYTAGSGNFPSCWTSISGTNYVEANGTYSTYASQGTKALHMQGPGTVATPIINIAGNDVFISFDMKCENVANSGDMAIGIATSPASVASAIWIDTIDAATTYNRYEYIYHNTLNIASGCIVFKQVNTTATNYYYWIDSLTVAEPPACAKPNGLTLDEATESSLTLSWTENGTASKWVVKVNDGEWATVTENPYTLDGLTANTEYAISVRSFCDPDTSDAVSGTFRTACATEVVTTDDSFEEEFEGITSGIPSCWAQTTTTWKSYATGNTGRGLYFTDYYGDVDTLITPEFNLSALTNGAQLRFWYKIPEEEDWYGDTYSATLEVLYRTSTSGEWTVGETLTETVEDWTEHEFVLPASSAAASYQIAFRAVSANDYTSTYVYLDGVVVEVAPSCTRPTDLAAATTGEEAVLTWTGDAAKYEVRYSADGVEWTSSEVTVNTTTITGLETSTNYQFEVRAICGDGDTSTWASVSARTACAAVAAADLPYFEGFESDISCWQQEAVTGSSATWELEDNGYYEPVEGASYVTVEAYSGNEVRLISPIFNVATVESLTMRFNHAQKAYSSSQDELTVEYRLSPSDAWVELAHYTENIESFQGETITIPQTSATMQIAFRAMLVYGYGVAIDSLSIYAEGDVPATCDVPTGLAANNVTENSAVINWTGNAAEYEVELNGDPTTVSTNSYNAQGLTAATNYAVRVRALCDGGLTSEWTAVVNFTTLDEPQPMECNTPTGLAASNVTANSANISWNEVTIAETFDGEWNLAMGAEDSVHTMITPDATMHTLLTALGMDFEDVDENVSVAGTLVPVTIEPAAGNQMNIIGSFDMAMYGVDDPVTFHFSTTGTVTSTGMNIEPATINETVRIMNAMDIDYTGTVTFAQPTALPVDGTLTIGIASMNISGYGDTTVYMMTGSVSISMVGTDLTASGSRETTNAYPTYELVVTNVATGVETPITNATTPYALEGLTASTEYTVKVRTHCDENSTSDWSAAVSFTTLNGGGEDPTCDVPTAVTTSNITATSVTVSWTGTASQYEVEVTDGTTPVSQTVTANQYTFTGLTASTNYTVRVRAICDGGVTSDWSAAQSFTTPNGGEPQGIDDVNASYSVNIYPNPAKNTVTISVDGLSGKAQVSVIDMSGRTVMTSTMESDATQLNVSKLAQGTYFVRINGESISTVRKLVVK